MLPPIARRIAVLATTGAFPPDQLDAMAELAQQANLVRYPAGHVLWDRGDDSSRLYVLLDGAMRLDPESGGGFSAVAGTLIGQFDAFAGVPRRTLATVTRDVEALSIGVDSFLDVLEDHPQLATGFLTIQARHVLTLRAVAAG
jgi:CRP-like cAMP-binding protein